MDTNTTAPSAPAPADWIGATVEHSTGDPVPCQVALADYAAGAAYVRVAFGVTDPGTLVPRARVLDTTGLPERNMAGHPLRRCTCGNVCYLPASAADCPACR